jgi:hypothetical protein
MTKTPEEVEFHLLLLQSAESAEKRSSPSAAKQAAVNERQISSAEAARAVLQRQKL